jgi:flavorubredoxin
MNVLIAYYPLGEAEKVALRLKKLFEEDNHSTELFPIETEITDIKKQFKKEKKLELSNKLKSIKKFDTIIIGTPIVSFKSVPAVNVFIRNLKEIKNKNVILFATGIGLPGRAIKKMSSLFSMNSAKVSDSQVFSSIFEFDSRKLKEVNVFYERFMKKIN